MRAAINMVGACTAFDSIVAIITIKLVITAATEHDIVASSSVERVICCGARYIIILGAAIGVKLQLPKIDREAIKQLQGLNTTAQCAMIFDPDRRCAVIAIGDHKISTIKRKTQISEINALARLDAVIAALMFGVERRAQHLCTNTGPLKAREPAILRPVRNIGRVILVADT